MNASLVPMPAFVPDNLLLVAFIGGVLALMLGVLIAGLSEPSDNGTVGEYLALAGMVLAMLALGGMVFL